MAALVRALVYATAFVGIVLVFLPARVLEWSGAIRTPSPGPTQWAGAVVTAAGAFLVVWCVLTFALVGRGTPAPFDPPRRLVVAGPYRFVRNPMYLGAGLALAGAALFYESLALSGFVVLFLLVTHLFVVLYEERALSRLFGAQYLEYSRDVLRWIPRKPTDRNRAGRRPAG